MKKNIIKLLIVTMGIALFFLTASLINRYTLSAKIINISNNIITAQDIKGKVWVFQDENKNNTFAVNERINITWNDKGTFSRLDDEILKIEKSVDK